MKKFVLVHSPIMLICNMMRFISLLLLGLDACGVCVVMWSSLSVCKVVLVTYVDTVVVVTVMHVLLFLLDVCMSGECKGEDGDGNAGVGEGNREGHEYMGCTRGSGIVSSTADVQGMRVVRVMREVRGVCGFESGQGGRRGG